MTPPVSPRLLIARKRDGASLSREEIAAFVRMVVTEEFSPAQVGAMLMAMVTRGMTSEEAAALTLGMRDSGERLHLESLSQPRIDKHSTGGVGDKVSLVLGPLAAACGLAVPMISGRGLGHTGGTLDKLESIPGFRVGLSIEEIERQVAQIGIVIAAQTKDLVPADRILYATRDVTATVESIPLITASILSKKLAEDLNGLVLDVKFGSGAFLPEYEAAQELAHALAATAHAAGCPTVALLTAMDQPLGETVGNALEVAEASRCLRGEGPSDLESLSISLTIAMLRLVDRSISEDEAQQRVRKALDSGAALEKWRELIRAQGGDMSVADSDEALPTASIVETVAYEGELSGYVSRFDARKVAEAAALLGAGRRKEGDAIDAAVGFSSLLKIGAPISPGTSVATIHANSAELLDTARSLLLEALEISSEPVSPPPLIAETIDSHELRSQ
jgi:pyrimidine-nucleoside phosphorylase